MKYEEFIAELCQKIREVTKGWSGTSIEFRTTPVSYTHLDVYKRQVDGTYPFVFKC